MVSYFCARPLFRTVAHKGAAFFRIEGADVSL
jgi:hypothetical protein